MTQKISPEGVRAWRDRYWRRVLVAALAFGVALPFIDVDGTKFVAEHVNEAYADLMGRSVFNGQPMGVTDGATLWMTVVGLVYLVHEFKRRGRPVDRRGILLGYLFFTFIFVGLALVQPLKYLMGRARPNKVWDLAHGLPFTQWFTWGPYFYGTDPLFNGSFPSGHTTSMMMTITLLYVVRFGTDWSEARKKWLERLVWFLALGGAVLMVAARSMSRHHWLSDTVMAVPMVCLVADVIFFRVLKVPMQLMAWQENMASRIRPLFLEGRILLLSLLVVLGVVLTGGALRALWRGDAMWLVGGVLLGPGLCALGWRGCQKWRGYL